MKRKIALALFACVAMLVVGYFAYDRLTYVEQDLDELVEYNRTQDYDILIGRIQQTPAPPEGFTFAVVGDTQSNYGVATRVMTAAAAEEPAFILHVGDLVQQGTISEYIAHHMRLVDAVAPIPVIPVPGNHDRCPNGDFAPFETIYGGDQFAFDYGAARFIGVNNASRYGMMDRHLRFIEKQVMQPRPDHAFVAFHIPANRWRFFEDPDERRGVRWNMRDLERLLAEHNVDQVFMGHIHGFATKLQDDVRYTVSGGGGGALSQRLPAKDRAYNYLLVHVQPEGVRTEVVKWVGEQWAREQVPIES